MVTIVGNHFSDLGEGPVWDDRSNQVCWVDIRKGTIQELNVQDGALKITAFGSPVGAIALCTDNDLLVAAGEGLVRLNRSSGERKNWGRPEGMPPDFRFNDGKCDPSGRFWVGTLSDQEIPGAGCCYRVGSDNVFTPVLEGLTIPNGMAWNKEKQAFYFIDTASSSVMEYHYEETSGILTRPRRAVCIPREDGYPDGMTIDREGMLWIAHWDGWQVSRWDPQRGMKLLTLHMPVQKVTSCVFGGADLNDLYITSARTGLAPDALEAQPLAGGLFVWKNCGYAGYPAARCSI